MARMVVVDLASDDQAARDLPSGGVFVPDPTLAFGDECTLVSRRGDVELQLAATCVWVDGHRGAGLELVELSAELKQQVAALVQAREPAEPPESEDEPEETSE